MSRTEVAVVGAGLIGLAAAYHLQKAGCGVTVVDRDFDAQSASMGNAGGIAVTEVFPASTPGVWRRIPGWLLDPLGPLAIKPGHLPRMVPWLTRFASVSRRSEVERISRALAAINRRVYEDLEPMLQELGLSHCLNHHGALTVYESEAGYRRDGDEWACKKANGIIVEELSGAEARNAEPALGPLVHRAIFTPQWSHLNDPKDLVISLRRVLDQRRVQLVRDEVLDVESPASTVLLHLRKIATLKADYAVIAAGVWSKTLAHRMGDRVLLESERGYNMTLPKPGISVRHQLIFAERKFVATPLTCGLRVGGAAEFGGLHAEANFRRSRALVALAQRYLPAMNVAEGTSWAGHRPTTPDSLPVLGPASRDARVLYAFGHGHLGLTQAATTGRLIADLILRRTPPIDMTPYAVSRFRG